MEENMKEKIEITDTPKHYSILSDVMFFFRHFKKYEPAVLVLSALEIALGAVIPLIGIYLPKLVMDIATDGVTEKKAIIILGLFTLMMAAVYSIRNIAGSGYHLYNSQRTNILGLVFLKSLRIRYEYVESGRLSNMKWKACESCLNGDWSASTRILRSTVTIATESICFALYSTVIGTLNIWMLIIIIGLSFINYAISMRQIKYEESIRDEKALAEKHYYGVRAAMGNVSGAKDIRIFGMNGWLMSLQNKAIDEECAVKRKSARMASRYEKERFILTLVRDLGAYAYLLYQATRGSLSAGEFVLYFGAIMGFSGFVTNIMDSLASMRDAANSIDYLRAYLELPDEDRTSGSRHIDELEYPVKIEFRDVSFSYKDSGSAEKAEAENEENSRPSAVFEHLNITINAGEKIALVGVNGAGKSTFVKLLCGLYEPDEGQILINDIDINEFPRTELYLLFSAVFQEQLILPFTVGENLAMDRADRVDEERAWRALERAGLKQTFEEKNIGIKSYMTRAMMKNGVELSGGQQQRFLLARALYKDAPVMVLDEPTAALDPIAESEVYDSYNKYSEGKTAVFISHRLASTRFSDRIVLIEGGRIVEMGTHEELMEKGGSYAQMFNIQSSYYKEPEGCVGI